jgi:predicted DsbA family dithiol-disulfide isomerase
MATPLKIDFVSDVSCPWCALGLKSLEQALERVGDSIPTQLHFQPFELNPQMAPEGENKMEHLVRKYGRSAQELAQNQEVIRERGAALGFEFRFGPQDRIYNTFDAHRLLHWAELEGKQAALKQALFEAYFSQGQDPSSHDLLVRVAEQVGLDPVQAKAILESDTYADAVRERERFYTDNGIHSVPAIIINDRHLISGGQPAEVFERALRQIAAGE